MRPIILFSILVLTAYKSFAQRVDSVNYGKGWVSIAKADSLLTAFTKSTYIVDGKAFNYNSNFEAVRVATYPNNYQALSADFHSEFIYPAQLIKQLSGTVRLSFIVQKDGTLAYFEVDKSLDPLIDDEIIRTLITLKKWKPAMQGSGVVKHMILLSFLIQPRE